MKKNYFGLLTILALSFGLIACEDLETEDETASEVTSERSAIVDGFRLSENDARYLGLVAVYHYYESAGRWYRRPCGGVVVSSSYGYSYVLTARHCVTSDLSENGPVLPPEKVMVAADNDPGPANPNPPSSAVPAFNITASEPHDQWYHQGDDLAIIVVNADWSDRAQGPIALYVGDPRGLAGRGMYSFGYGLSEPDWECPGNDNYYETSGVARWGWFGIVEAWISDGSPNTGYYEIPNSSSFGQQIICGDSGGPDMIPLNGWLHVAGIHSEGDDEHMFSDTISRWVQDQLSGLYVTPVNMASRHLGMTSWPNVVLKDDNSSSGFSIRLKYDRSQRRISIANDTYCLSYNTQDGLTLELCDGSSDQSWSVSYDLRIYHRGVRKCLKAHSNNQLTMETCNTSDASQKFAWHAQQ